MISYRSILLAYVFEKRAEKGGFDEVFPEMCIL